MKSLNPVEEKFILHWGEMGTRWGINRTVAQIHALLYLASEPLPADEIAEILGIARSNVSTSLRELQNWNLVRVVHRMGDRRDHFETPHDVWELFRIVAQERKRREIDPTLAMLRECLESLKGKNSALEGRIRAMLDFFETTDAAYEALQRIPLPSAARLARNVEKVLKMAGAA